jgi:hypothetical protein
METATADDIFGDLSGTNTLAWGDERSQEPSEEGEIGQVVKIRKNPQELLDEALRSAVRVSFPNPLEGVGRMATKVIDVAGEFLKTIGNLIVQAIRIAVFKFALEFCAMAIKTLVEAIQGKGLTPSKIDTAGVFYNIGNAASQPGAPAASAPSRPLSYEDPFSTGPSPYGSRW